MSRSCLKMKCCGAVLKLNVQYVLTNLCRIRICANSQHELVSNGKMQSTPFCWVSVLHSLEYAVD